MDVASLTRILNYALLGLFIGVLVILLLCFLRGLARGWRYGLYRLISFVVFIGIGLACLKPLGNWIGNYDLSAFHIPEIGFDVNANDTTTHISATFGKPYEAIASLIEQYVQAIQGSNDLSTTSAAIANYANALAQSIVMLLCLFIEGLLLCTVVNLFILLMWHILWKHFIPKEKRKESYHKGKLWSAFSDLTVGALCLAMLIFPLTSLVNTASNSVKQVNNDTATSVKADSGTYDTIQSVVDAYDNSLFAKVFFNWSANSQGLTYDAQLTNWLTQSDYNGTQIGFVNELSSLSKVYVTALKGGLLSSDGMKAQTITYFLCSYYTPELLKALSQSGLVTGLLPFALQVASNLEPISNFLKTDAGIDFTAYDFGKSLRSLSELYSAVVKSDFSEGMVDENGNLIANDEIVKKAFSGEGKTPMEDLLKGLDSDDLKIFNVLISSAVFHLAVNLSAANSASTSEASSSELSAATTSEETSSSLTSYTLADFLPALGDYDTNGDGVVDAIPDSFLSIDWGNQVATLYDCVVQLCSIDGSFLNFFASTLTSGFNSQAFDSKKMLGLLVDNIDKVGTVIYGADAASTASTNGAVKAAETETTTSPCLLDSLFVENAIAKTLDVLGNMVDTSFSLTDDPLDLTSIKDTLINSEDYAAQVTAVKKEIKALFGVMTGLASTEEGKTFLKDLQHLPGIHFDPDGKLVSMDDGLSTGLIAGLKKLDDSKIATVIMPRVFNHFLSGKDSIFAQSGIDLELSFTGVNLGTNIAKFITTYEDCEELINLLQGVNSNNTTVILKTIGNYSDQLLELLDMVVDNPILNPAGSLNRNLFSIINTLLSATFGDYSAELKATIESETFSAKDEMEALVKIVMDLSQYDFVSKLSSLNGSADLSVLSDIDFEALFTDLGNSKIITSFLGKFLDSKVSGVSYFSDGTWGDGGISFTYVTDWAAEGRAVAALVKAANEIGDLGNIDYLHSDPDSVAAILQSLSQSPIFTNKEGTYLFSDFMASKLSTYFAKAGESAKFFSDYDLDTNGNYTYDTVKHSFSAITKEQWSAEASAFGEILYQSQRLGSFNGLSAGKDLRGINPDTIAGLLSALNTSRGLAQVVTYHVYAEMNASLVSGAEAFSHSNLRAIYDADSALRTSENACLVKMVHAILDPSGVDNNGHYTYVFLDSNGNINAGSLDVTSASPDYTVKPLLQGLADSRVFNTRKVVDATTTPVTYDTVTSFQAEMADILLNSGLYGDKTLLTTKNKVSSVVAGYAYDSQPGESSDETTRFTAWNNEIDSLCYALSDLQDADLSFASLNFNTFFKDGNGNPLSKAEREEKRLQVQGLLDDMNDSALLYPALPIQLENAINSIATSGTGDFSLTGANTSYNGALPYGRDEDETLSYILEDSSLLGTFSASDLSALTDDQIATASRLLAQMSKSHIFNSSADGTSETVFQKNFASLFVSGQLKDLYFRTGSPKDSANAAYYTSSTTKATYVTVGNFPAVKASDDLSNQDTSLINGKTGSFQSVLESLKGDSALTSAIQNGATNTLTATQISKLLKTLNSCVLYQDFVPNIIDNFLKGGSSSINLNNINLNRAYSYYCYYFDSAQNKMVATADFKRIYSDGEIDLIAQLIENLNHDQTLFQSLSTNTGFSETNIASIKAILDDLSESYVFHAAGAYQPVATNGSLGVADDLTVFEQAIFSLYDQTGLSGRAYSAIYDPTFASDKEKLHSGILAFNARTLGTSHQGDWQTEIRNLTVNDSVSYATDPGHCGLLTYGVKAGLLGNGVNLNSSQNDKTNFSKMAPSEISALSYAFNGLDLVKDALPYGVAEMIEETVHFSAYSMLSSTYSNVTAFDSVSDLGFVGRFQRLVITSTSGTPSVSYSLDGVTYLALPSGNISASGTTYTVDLSAYKPLAFQVASGTYSSLVVTFNSSNYFVNQATYEGKNQDGAIALIVNFANAIYDSSSKTYLNFSNESSVTSFLTSGSELTGVLDYIGSTKGFYYQRFYTANAVSATEIVVSSALETTATFASRDVAMRSLLNFDVQVQGVSKKVSLGNYLGKDENGSFSLLSSLEGAEAMFQSSAYDAATESTWLKAHLLSTGKVEGVIEYGDQQYLGVSLPKAHSWTYLFAQDTEKNFKNVVSAAANGASLFGKRFAAGLLDRYLQEQYSYESSTTNYVPGSITANAPSAYLSTARSSYLSAAYSGFSVPNFYENYAFTSLSADASTALEKLFDSAYYLNMEDSKVLTATQIAAAQADFAALDTLFATANTLVKQLTQITYCGANDDYFVYRGYFHGTLGGMSEVDFLNPCVSGFTYASAAATIA